MRISTKRRLSHPEDVVDVAVAILRANATELSAQKLMRFELEMRQRFGGAREYVRKRPAFRKAEALHEAVRRGTPLQDAYTTVGVSERHGRHLLKRRADRRGA